MEGENPPTGEDEGAEEDGLDHGGQQLFIVGNGEGDLLAGQQVELAVPFFELQRNGGEIIFPKGYFISSTAVDESIFVGCESFNHCPLYNYIIIWITI